jgi:hypothetical protein
MNSRFDLPSKVGLLLVALAYFSFSFYEMTISSLENKQSVGVMTTDLPGALGLGFRTVGGFIAVVAILLYFFRSHLSKPEAIMSARYVVVLEAAYWLSLLPSGYVGVRSLFTPGRFFSTAFFVECGLPCLVESILMPIVLSKLFYELSPNRPVKNAIKWGLISGVSYLLVAWLNNMGNWVYALAQKGVQYISLYPVNAFSFAVTTVGLLLLTAYAAYFAKKSFGAESFDMLDLNKIGLILTFFGLYMDLNYVLWLLFGSVGGWGVWYAWMLGHNMDQWVLALSLLGLPLLFRKKK